MDQITEYPVPKWTPYVTGGKNEKDVAILKAIIEEQKALGSDLPADLDHWRYTWESGRLVRINWNYCKLKERLSLEGLDALKALDCYGSSLSGLDFPGNA